MHWTRKYFLENNKQTCSAFVEQVLREQFNIDYKFPQSSGSVFDQSYQIKQSMPLFCKKTETPKDGDLVLMHGKRRLCHVGLYLKIGRKDFVFHTELNMDTVSLHHFKDVFKYGYTVEGVYTWLK